MLNWISTPNYEELITGAVDVPVAEGHGFVTEYAGNSNVVTRVNLVQPQWSAGVFANADPLRVIDLLKQQGFITFCGGGSCGFTHALILPLLRQYLPAPAGVDEGGFYDCLPCYANEIDKTVWGDGTGFARALEERVIVPGRHASDLLSTNPYLTRMYTTISPAEMTVDPTFQEVDGLPAIGAVQTATSLSKCDGKTGVVLPDGREVGLASVQNPSSPSAAVFQWPTFTSVMPWAERIEEVTSAGPIVLVDNRGLIDRLLPQWNDSIGWTPEGLDAGASGAGGAGGTASGSGGAIIAPGAGGGSLTSDPGFAKASGGGCSCSLFGRPYPSGWMGGGLFVWACALAAARRRTSSSTTRSVFGISRSRSAVAAVLPT
jgi:hypothetical protein